MNKLCKEFCYFVSARYRHFDKQEGKCRIMASNLPMLRLPSACVSFPSLPVIPVPDKGWSPTVPVSSFFGITGAGSGAGKEISPPPGAGFPFFGIAVASLIFIHPRQFRFPRL